MATRFYLLNNVSPFAPTAGNKSVALPTGTNNSLTTFDNVSLGFSATTADTTINLTTLAQTTLQSGKFARFTSPYLSAQTISANTWTFALRNQESNNSANAYTAVSMYIWRPRTSSVVGYIYDSATQLGAEWFSYQVNTYTFSGSAITIQDNDVLVIEPWYTAIQGGAKSYTNSIRYGLNSYIETPQNLSFATEEISSWIIY